MRVQRVRGVSCQSNLLAESRAEMQIAKWTAEGMVKGVVAEYSMTYWHTLVAGDMFVSC